MYLDANNQPIEEPADKDVTLKIKGLTKQNEIDYAQYKYDEALKAMMANPTSEKAIKDFEEANAKLYEVQDAYRIGARLLLEYKVTHASV